jgi:phosphoglycerate dehydrogenase-like enzyme
MFKFGFQCKIYALRRKRERKGEEDDEDDNELLDGLYEGDISDVDLVGSFPSGRNNIVVIACTCTPENRKMVNKTFLDSLKFGEERVPGIVVNVARGALVDERAMREACENGTVLYYATDVCYDEPVDVGGDLLSLGENGKRASNIFVTPHVGGVTVNSYERMGKIVAEYARKIVKEKRIESDECVSIVN